MNFRCSSVIHACPVGTDQQFPYDLAFYSLADPVHPRLISTYVPTSAAGLAVKPHEMYLWQDPRTPGRALLWISTPELTSDPAVPNMMIADISKVAAGGPVTEVAEGNWNQLYPDGGSETAFQNDLYTHSMAPTADGTRTYPTFGCPWGWSRLIGVADPAHPQIVGEYKITQDTQAFCGSPADDPATEQFTSYSSHNPTVLPDLALIDWHSGGVHAIDTASPAGPRPAGWY